MQLTITGIGIELTPPLKQYVEKEIGGLARYLGSSDSEAVRTLVEVGRESRHHRHDHVMFARVNIALGRTTLRAESKTQDAWASIDEVRTELHAEILKFKGKREALFRRGARSIKKFLHLSPLARFRKSKISE